MTQVDYEVVKVSFSHWLILSRLQRFHSPKLILINSSSRKTYVKRMLIRFRWKIMMSSFRTLRLMKSHQVLMEHHSRQTTQGFKLITIFDSTDPRRLHSWPIYCVICLARWRKIASCKCLFYFVLSNVKHLKVHIHCVLLLDGKETEQTKERTMAKNYYLLWSIKHLTWSSIFFHQHAPSPIKLMENERPEFRRAKEKWKILSFESRKVAIKNISSS